MQLRRELRLQARLWLCERLRLHAGEVAKLANGTGVRKPARPLPFSVHAISMECLCGPCVVRP